MFIARLKQSLNIKYFMAGYLCLLVLLASFYFKDLVIFADGILLVALYTGFDLLWTYARDRVWYLPTSAWISGFVLTIGAFPKPPLLVLIVLPLLAVASKQLLHFGKNRHLFNPAAFALAVISLFNPAVSWWAVAGAVLPTIAGLQKLDLGMWLFLFTFFAALIILWKQNRWHITLPFLFSYAFFIGVFSLVNGVVLGRLPNVLFFQIANGAVLFFSTVMVIEPITSTFSTKRQEILYGAMVGLAAVVIIYFSRKFNLVNLDPLVFGLLSGNLIAGLMFLPARKLAKNSSVKKGCSSCVDCSCKEAAPAKISREPSYWFRDVPDQNRFPVLQGDKEFDAVIVGGGIAGVAVAYFLAKNGLSAAVLEAGTIGSGDSSYTTACATRFLDSVDASLKAWESSAEAIAMLKKIVEEENIDCDWQDVDTICFSRETDKKSLNNFLATAQKFQSKDSSIEYLVKDEASASVGVPVSAAYQKKSAEGMFHMRKLLMALAERAIKNGALFFEDSEATNFTFGDQVVVKTKKGGIKAKWLIVATGLPPVKFFPAVSKLLRSAVSYVIDVKFAEKPPFAKAFFWDDQDPYHYFRSVAENEFILGGEDWKTNSSKPDLNPHLQLEKWFKNLVGRQASFKVVNSWQGSLFYTPDTLPLVGPHPKYGKNIIFLTGWAGNGTAQGVFAASMAVSIIQKKNNPYYHLFACDRKLSWPVENNSGNLSVLASVETGALAKEYLENKGKILEVAGQKLAVIKTNGKIKAFSALCPHLGCAVGWNDTENTWDCPCHGSRFESDGSLKNGPAKRGLDPVEIKLENDQIKIV
ncbi:MAG TPA: FAD-dependent oxidoreductase [Candidatus Udaeobacter sp.]|nr:FAD-dependent oxidoreductase [Candidatus Udaeobacter sp.]